MMKVMYRVISSVLQCAGYILFVYLGNYSTTHDTKDSAFFMLGCIGAALLVEAGHSVREVVTDP